MSTWCYHTCSPNRKFIILRSTKMTIVMPNTWQLLPYIFVCFLGINRVSYWNRGIFISIMIWFNTQFKLQLELSGNKRQLFWSYHTTSKYCKTPSMLSVLQKSMLSSSWLTYCHASFSLSRQYVIRVLGWRKYFLFNLEAKSFSDVLERLISCH